MNDFTMMLLAASNKIDPAKIGIKDPIKDTNSLITGVLNPVYMWAGIICVAIIIIAGYYYVISAGNATHIKRAKDAIMGAVIGIIVIMMAFMVTQFVIGRF